MGIVCQGVIDELGVMATRDDVHRLVGVLPEGGVAAIGSVLRAAIEAGMTDEQVHRLAEQLLAERVEEILRTEPDPAA